MGTINLQVSIGRHEIRYKIKDGKSTYSENLIEDIIQDINQSLRFNISSVYNDPLAYKTGVKLLCEVALRLQSSVREGDTVARLGGDKFTVILEDEYFYFQIAVKLSG